MKLTLKKENGFSLVEILIVVCILGILAAIVVPHYTNATTKAKEASAKELLQSLNTQIGLYTTQHNGLPPGYIKGGSSDVDALLFMKQLFFNITDTRGYWTNYPATGYDFGPYFTDMPTNPINGIKGFYMVIGDWPTEAIYNHGWLYQPSSRAIRLNSFGKDSEGKEYQGY